MSREEHEQTRACAQFCSVQLESWCAVFAYFSLISCCVILTTLIACGAEKLRLTIYLVQYCAQNFIPSSVEVR